MKRREVIGVRYCSRYVSELIELRQAQEPAHARVATCMPYKPLIQGGAASSSSARQHGWADRRQAAPARQAVHPWRAWIAVVPGPGRALSWRAGGLLSMGKTGAREGSPEPGGGRKACLCPVGYPSLCFARFASLPWGLRPHPGAWRRPPPLDACKGESLKHAVETYLRCFGRTLPSIDWYYRAAMLSSRKVSRQIVA